MIEIHIRTGDMRAWWARALGEFQINARQALGQAAALAVHSAKTSSRYKSRTGELARSIHRAPMGAWAWKISADAPHAAYVEFGTRPHRIDARRAKALRFVQHGRVVFRRSVQHPGTQPTHFLWRSVDAAGDELEDLLVRAMRRSFR